MGMVLILLCLNMFLNKQYHRIAICQELYLVIYSYISLICSYMSLTYTYPIITPQLYLIIGFGRTPRRLSLAHNLRIFYNFVKKMLFKRLLEWEHYHDHYHDWSVNFLGLYASLLSSYSHLTFFGCGYWLSQFSARDTQISSVTI